MSTVKKVISYAAIVFAVLGLVGSFGADSFRDGFATILVAAAIALPAGAALIANKRGGGRPKWKIIVPSSVVLLIVAILVSPYHESTTESTVAPTSTVPTPSTSAQPTTSSAPTSEPTTEVLAPTTTEVAPAVETPEPAAPEVPVQQEIVEQPAPEPAPAPQPEPAPAPQPEPAPAPQPEPAPAPQPEPAPAPAPAPAVSNNGGSVYYKNCAAVRAAGKAPLYRGQPGYTEGPKGLDRDSDGVACE